MELIDWQELYAANRAVIEGRDQRGAVSGFASPAPGMPGW